jgi:dTMP kinase
MNAERGSRQRWFVTLEGPEGSGKTTIAAALAASLAAVVPEVVLTREPGGTPLGEAVREVLLARGPEGGAPDARAEALLFNAARAQLVADVIEPALGRGALVLCARFADSTAAYQGAGRGLDVDGLRAIEAFATRGLRPDLTILLDVPVEIGLARKGPEEETRFEALDVAFHERVRGAFLAFAAADPARFVVIDATRDAPAVLAAAQAALRDRLGLAAGGRI